MLFLINATFVTTSGNLIFTWTGDGNQIIMIRKMDTEERSRKAREYFRDGYNCCQSVLLAFEDVIGMSKDEIASLSSGFGGGMGRLREVCGAMSAMTFMAGVVCPASDPLDQKKKTDNYALVQKFAGEFKEENGSIICRELLQIRASQKESPAPSTRTEQYYTNRPCERIVGAAARIIAENLDNKVSQPQN